jgi:hypothetical protein
MQNVISSGQREGTWKTAPEKKRYNVFMTLLADLFWITQDTI